MKIHGLYGGIVLIIGNILFFTSCNDSKDVTFQYKNFEIVQLESFSFRSVNNNVSSIYIYEGKDDNNELSKKKFVLYNQIKLLYFFNDNPEYISAISTSSKQVIINKKIVIVDAYWLNGFGHSDLLYFFFTKEYGLLLIKFVGAEYSLIKFDEKESEIRDLINAIKEDTEFYEWGGREPIYPPND